MAVSLGGVVFSISVKTGRTASQIDRVTKALIDLNAAAGQAAPNLQAIQAALNAFSVSANAAGQSSRAATTGVDALASGIAALGGAIAASKLTNFIADSTLLAGRVENLGTILENVGGTANYSYGEIKLFEANVKRLGITTQASREILARFAQNNLSLADAVKLARIAQDAAVISGKNSSETAEKLATAIFRLDTRMLRNQGILVNLRQEYQSFGLVTGRVETSLTATEKQQIALNAVFRQGLAIAGNYEKSLNDVFKQFTSLQRFQEEASRTFGEQFLPVFGDLVTSATNLLKAFEKLDSGTKSLLASAAAGVTVFISLGAVVGSVVAAYKAYNFVVAASAATTTTATVAVGGLARALALLRGALATLVSIPGLIGVSALIAGYIALTSRARNAAADLDKATEKGAEAAAKFVNARPGIVALQEFADKGKLTAEETAAMRTQMLSLVSLLPEFRDEMLGATDSVDDFLSVLQQKFPEGFQTFEQFVQKAESDLKVAKLRLEAAKNRFDFRDKGLGILDPFRTSDTAGKNEELKQAEAFLKTQEAIYRGAIEAENAYAIRQLEATSKLQETGVQLAERLRSRLEDAAFKDIKDKATDAIRDLLQQQRSLTAATESDAQIDEFRRRKQQAIEAQQKPKEESEAEFRARKQGQLLELENEIQKKLRDRAAIQGAFATSSALAAEALKGEEEATSRLNEEIALLEKGLSKDLIAAQQKLKESAAGSKTSIELLKKTIAALEVEIESLEKASRVPGLDVATRLANEQTVVAIRQQISLIERAKTATLNKQLAEEKIIQREITAIRKRETEERIKDIEKEGQESLDLAQKILKENRDARSNTENFIQDTRASLKDFFELPGFKQLYDVTKEFSQAISGAGTKDQIKQVRELFGASLNKKLIELGQQGAPPVLLNRLALEARSMVGLLDQAAIARSQELERQDLAFTVTVQQLRYLQGIYELLRTGRAPTNSQQEAAGTQGLLQPRRGRKGPLGGILDNEINIDPNRLPQSFGASSTSGLSVADRKILETLGAGGSPFSADIRASLSGTINTAKLTTESMQGLSTEVISGMRRLSTELESQRVIAAKTIESLRSLSGGVQRKEKRAEESFRSRGL